MMDRDIHNPRSQSLGCKILANLSHDPAVRQWIIKVKAIAKIMEAIKRHQNSSEVVVECCRTLTNLAFHLAPNKEAIVQEHGIEIILDTMTLHKTNVKLINSGLIALRNIVNNKMVMELQQDTLTREVLMTMQNHRPISDIQIHSIWILTHLMTGKAELKKRIALGAIDNIFAAMETHKSDKDVQLAGTTALALLAKLANNRTLIVKQKGIPVIVSAIQSHRTCIPVQRAALKTLFRLAANKAIRENIINASIINEVSVTMKQHPNSMPLQRAAILALLQFSKNPGLRGFIQQEAVSLVLMAHNKFTEDSEKGRNFRKVSQLAVESLVISAPAVDVSVIEEQIKDMKSQLKEKEKLIKKFVDQKVNLEIELEALKEFQDMKHEHSVEETLQKVKKELIKLQQYKETLNDEIKKSESQMKLASTELEEWKAKLLKEDHKKQEKRTSDALDEKKKGDSKKTKTTITEKPALTKAGSKDKKLITGPAKDTKSKGRKDHTRSKSSGSVEFKVDESMPIDKKHHSKTHSLNEAPRIQIDLAEPPPSFTQHNQGGTDKPRLERSLSRSLSRHQYLRTTSTTNVSEGLHLRKTLDGLIHTLEEKNNKIKENIEEKHALEEQTKKLTVDIKGAHILIQTLQKENQVQGPQRDKMNLAGGSVVMRQQKKIKALKEQLEMLQHENSELKKELQAAKKKKKPVKT
eukprot:TRINITY_DN27712_c0_g1_i1.p1 TRINITY_DN27712_c0_g1~~TRINITY_DN27712_c0_g1_i1.p1  ORF type:complete len:814 (-),score=232.17 TRINITY_DN27712_c0_g1_i1:57-2138(-)